MKKILSALILCTILGLSLASCSSDCTGEIAAGGKTYSATSKNAEDAKRFTCNKYCLDTDSKCEAMYGIWRDSPAGKAAGQPPKMRALSEDKQLLDCVTIECADRCLSDAAAGKVLLKLDCK